MPDGGVQAVFTAEPAEEIATRPRLRGWLHAAAFFASLPAGIALVVLAPGGRVRVAAAIYAVGLATVFGVSASYHRGNWNPAAHRRMKRLDHGVIFVMIAGTYTPFCLLVLRGGAATGVLIGVWIGAVVGLGLAATGLAERPCVGLACYLALGWVAVGALPQILQRLSIVQIGLLVAGGLIYTTGSVGLATRWPDPFPTVFGYHEVWHAMVVAAGTCHYVLVLSLVRGV